MGGLVAACRSIDICKDPHPAVLESGSLDSEKLQEVAQLHEEAPYVRIHPMRSSEIVRDRETRFCNVCFVGQIVLPCFPEQRRTRW